MRRAIFTTGVAAVTAVAAGCTSSSATSQAPNSGSSAHVVLRLGVLTNITNAPALIGIAKGYFAKSLGKNVKLEVQPFSTGTEEIGRAHV